MQDTMCTQPRGSVHGEMLDFSAHPDSKLLWGKVKLQDGTLGLCNFSTVTFLLTQKEEGKKSPIYWRDLSVTAAIPFCYAGRHR